MDNYSTREQNSFGPFDSTLPGYAPVEVVGDSPPGFETYAQVRPPRRMLPLLLFGGTCLSTFFVYFLFFTPGLPAIEALIVGVQRQLALAYLIPALGEAAQYAAALIFILLCHELGHFFQARRYGVHASFPYFIPMPLSPIGTLGAVIAMDPRRGDRKALFDIGITGPLAGLVPTLVFCVIGLQLSHSAPAPVGEDGMRFGEPLLLQWLGRLVHGEVPPGHDLILNPFLFAGWVGLLITSLNLFPIGQLDGGHILFGLLRHRAYPAASAVLYGAVAAIVIGAWQFEERRLLGWTPMLILVSLMGPRHPPTADDNVPLGLFRHVLGWATLAFLPLGFTPIPFP